MPLFMDIHKHVPGLTAEDPLPLAYLELPGGSHGRGEGGGGDFTHFIE